MDMYLCDLKHFVVAYCGLLCFVVVCGVFCSVLWWFVVFCSVLWWFVVFSVTQSGKKIPFDVISRYDTRTHFTSQVQL